MRTFPLNLGASQVALVVKNLLANAGDIPNIVDAQFLPCHLHPRGPDSASSAIRMLMTKECMAKGGLPVVRTPRDGISGFSVRPGQVPDL